jgi:hypothetical protein
MDSNEPSKTPVLDLVSVVMSLVGLYFCLKGFDQFLEYSQVMGLVPGVAGLTLCVIGLWLPSKKG